MTHHESESEAEETGRRHRRRHRHGHRHRRGHRYEKETRIEREGGRGEGMRDDYEREREGTTWYRSRDGVIFGVCRGIAQAQEVSVFWVRVFAIGIACFTGVWPAVGLYLVAALVMKIEPVLPLETDEDEEFYHSFSASRGMALQRLKRTFDNLDRRIQRIENTVTARDYDWEERLNS